MSAADFIQADRLLRIDDLLDADQLLAEKLTMKESISALFQLTVQVRSKRDDISADEVIGKHASVSVKIDHEKRRVWHGLVTEMVSGASFTRELVSFTLTLRPDLWLLTQKSDCRIWLDKTSVDVCTTLLSEHGLPTPVTSGIVNEVPKQHYSVQYNESDFAYLIRRLEDDGIFYWFEHGAGKHTLHIANFESGYTGNLDTRIPVGESDHDQIKRFDTRFCYTPGNFAGRDWNFETPEMVPDANTPSLVKFANNDQYTLYEYPMLGGYGDGDRASEGIKSETIERQARLRMQAIEAEHCRIEGESSVCVLSPGAKFTPYEINKLGNSDYTPHVILSVEHEAVDESYDLSSSTKSRYSNHFLALPAKIAATPIKTIQRPRIDGTQIAIISGPEGEEIHPDEYGRIKVWFPWDRRAKKDGSDTCWIRVIQNWAGIGWGGQIVPRVGMEAIISYLEGDPDRPVVIGITPNKRQKVPYSLPKHKTKSVFRTNTHKGEGFNELSFEDQSGEEKIYMHGQKDQEIHIENDRSKRIDRNQLESIGRNKTIEVGNNHHEVIGGNMTLMVGPNKLQRFVTDKFRALTSTLGDMTSKLGLPDFLNMGEGNMIIGVAKNKAETVLLSSTEVVGAGKAVTVGGGYQTVVGGIHNTTVGIGSYEEVGQNKTTIVGKQYEIVCGDSKILMQEDGTIAITGKKILLDAEELIRGTAKDVKIN